MPRNLGYVDAWDCLGVNELCPVRNWNLNPSPSSGAYCLIGLGSVRFANASTIGVRIGESACRTWSYMMLSRSRRSCLRVSRQGSFSSRPPPCHTLDLFAFVHLLDFRRESPQQSRVRDDCYCAERHCS